MISYDEIVLKYVEGKLIPGLDWIIKNLEQDPEVMAGASDEKERLRKFLQGLADQMEEFMQAGGVDERDNQDDTDIFGDEDIIVAPDSDENNMGDFMDGPEDPEDDDPFGFGGDFGGGG